MKISNKAAKKAAIADMRKEGLTTYSNITVSKFHTFMGLMYGPDRLTEEDIYSDTPRMWG